MGDIEIDSPLMYRRVKVLKATAPYCDPVERTDRHGKIIKVANLDGVIQYAVEIEGIPCWVFAWCTRDEFELT